MLDTWIACHRSARTRDRGAPIAGRVLVGRAARALTRVVFALEHRWTPLDHWLEAELATLADPAGAVPLLLEGIAGADPAPLRQAIERLGGALDAERIPTDQPGRQALFLELMHPRCAGERATHALR